MPNQTLIHTKYKVLNLHLQTVCELMRHLFFFFVDFSLQTVALDFTVKTSHASKQPHNFNTCSRPTFCIEMHCKTSNFFKTLNSAGQACACAFHLVALECRDLLRLRDLRDCYKEADCHSSFDSGRA